MIDANGKAKGVRKSAENERAEHVDRIRDGAKGFARRDESLFLFFDYRDAGRTIDRRARPSGIQRRFADVT